MCATSCFDYSPDTVAEVNFETRTGTLPNGAPTGGTHPELIRRDPVTGAVQDVTVGDQNIARIITEGLDYEALYQLDTSIFGRGNFGTYTFTLNGNYLARARQNLFAGEPRLNVDGQYLGPRRGALPKNRWYASAFYDLGGLDFGATVHFVSQMYDQLLMTPAFAQGLTRKIREWTTLDLIVNYTFHLPQSVNEPVPGYAKGGDKNPEKRDRADKNVMPISTAEYSSSGWRAWLNNTTITLGMNNVFDQNPPFAATPESHYDEWDHNIRGRVWYVALKKRF